MSDRLAILIGNGRFDHARELPDLFGPRHDVASLGRLLGDPEVGNFVVFELTDRDSNQLSSELQRLFTMVGPDSTVLLYYAGHVILDEVHGLHLATDDTELEDVPHSSISLGTVKDLLRGCGSRQMIMLLDCCYSTPGRDAILEEPIERELRGIRADVSPDLHVFASPASAQTPGARETGTESGIEGRLTRCIVDGISSGAVDRRGDNRATARDLNEYLGMRLGDQRPLWSGPVDGVDPKIVNNPNPIEGTVQQEPEIIQVAPEEPRPRSMLPLALTLLAAVVLAVTAVIVTRPDPGATLALETYPDLPGVPEQVGLVHELSRLRALIDRTGWVEHHEYLDGSGFAYPSAWQLTVNPANRGGPHTVDLAAHEWAVLDLSPGTYALAFLVGDGLNVARVEVELVDDRTFAFEVRTDRADRHFYGVVSPVPIRRVRLESGASPIVVRELYLYADDEHPAARQRTQNAE